MSPMHTDRTKTLLLLAAGLLVGATLAYGYGKLTSFKLWSRTMGEVRSAAPEEILVMRTRGGLLEVSRISATEVFDARFVHTVLGMRVGDTVPSIRVPAVYRYSIELAPEWSVLRTGDAFTVIAPPVRPSLPVAVDLGRLERSISGTWMLLPFTSTDDLNDLEHSITASLARKAVSPAYIQMQREHARKTVEEFVRKWLVTQAQWQSSSRSNIRVFFADEPMGSVGLQRLRVQPPARPAAS